jgi:hypothetical protein
LGGNFDLNPWQRGATITSPANGQYLADRWSWLLSGTGVVTVTKTSDAPPINLAGFYTASVLKIATTTAKASPTASDIYALLTKIEGVNYTQLAQNLMNLSFLVKATVTGTYCVAIYNGGNDRCFIGTFSVGVTNTWQAVSIAIPASPSAGTWSYTAGTTGLNVLFVIAAGSNYQGTAGSWQSTTNVFCTSSQANGMSSTSNIFEIQNVQLEPGNIASPYQFVPEEVILAQCQRYFVKSFPTGTPPAANTGINGAFSSPFAATATGIFGYFDLPVEMCGVSPTITLYNPSVAANAQVRDVTAATNFTSCTGAMNGNRQLAISGTSSSTTVVGNELAVNWTIAQELP